MMKRWIPLLLAIALVATLISQLTFSARAADEDSGTCGENLHWSFDEITGELTITGSGAMYAWESGPEIYDRPWHDHEAEIRTVVIEEGVTEIGIRAISNCHNLTSVTIPSSVTSIGSNAFDGCTSLTEITIPNGVTTIGYEAFNQCSSLTSVKISSSVTDIDFPVFSDCSSLTTVDVASDNSSYSSADGMLFDKDKTSLLWCPCVKTGAFQIPAGVTSIGTSAFKGCSELTDIKIPDSVTSIGASAFAGCSKLTSIIIPDSVTKTGRYTFEECSSLISVTLSSSATSINDGEFLGCSSLKSITIPSGVTKIGYHSFVRCNSLTEINVDKNNQFLFSDEHGVLFDKNQSILLVYPAGSSHNSYAIPEGVKKIDSYAFSFCSNLTTVVIPASMNNLDAYAFILCSSLEEVTLLGSVETIGSYAFYECENLAGMNIPDGVTSIGERAFYGCKNLESITIPSSVQSIGHLAFRNCSSLTKLTILSEQCQIVNDSRTLGVPGTTTIYANDGSTAETYAREFGYHFVTIYTVIFDANGGTGAPSSQYRMEGEALTLSSVIPTKSFTITFDATGGSVSSASKTLNCEFFYWDSSLNGTGVNYRPGRQYTSDLDIILYATWKNPTLGELPRPTPAQPNNRFEDWYTEPNGGEVVTESTIVTGDMTLYAHWEVPSGKCGPNLSWFYNKYTGNMTITGSGEMDHWISINKVPWYQFAGQITNLSLPTGLTKIGQYAFYGCSSLQNVTIPDTVTSIEKYAFQNCSSLKGAVIGKGVESIEEGAFRDCLALAKAAILNPNCVFPENNSTTIGDAALRQPVIYSVKDSAVEKYAADKGYTFIDIGIPPFADISGSAYYADPVLWAVVLDITNGTSDTTFSPDAACTRAQVLTFLWRATGCPKPVDTVNFFTDIKHDAYYYKAVLWAVEQGITLGTSERAFSPEASCTRAQVVTFLWRASGQPEPESGVNPITDVAPNAYYYKAVLWAMEQGVTTGTSETAFSPDSTCTRGQIVTFLYRNNKVQP